LFGNIEKKLWANFIFSFLSLLLISCGTIVDYVGNSYTPSNKVDVFVTLSSVKKEYQIIGKGYADDSPLLLRRIGEKIQKKAIQKAKSKGADAIVIQDYLLLQPMLQTSVQTDSTSSRIALSNIAVNQQSTTRFTILFLKYTSKN
jgi:hypothetical protein